MTTAPVAEERPKREHHRTHFTRRLEGFSDIVFGLSLAQTAIQLQVPETAYDLTHNYLRYLIFFATFAMISSLWLSHYRVFRLAFEPEPVDIFLNFVFLAFTALLPYAMLTNIRYNGVPFALALYAIGFAGTSLSICVITLRGLRRRDPTLTEAERLVLWRAAVRTACVTVAAAMTLALLTFLPTYYAVMPFPLLGIAMGVIRRRVRTIPARYQPAAG